MSPKDFRQLSHPEQKILNSLVNWRHTHRQTDRHTWVNLELTPRGGSAKNTTLSYKYTIFLMLSYFAKKICLRDPDCQDELKTFFVQIWPWPKIWTLKWISTFFWIGHFWKISSVALCVELKEFLNNNFRMPIIKPILNFLKI